MTTVARRRRHVWRSRWWMPAVSLALGCAMFAAFAIGGSAGEGAMAFGLMAIIAAVFWFGRRSETLQGLGGPGRDERWAMIDLRATAITGIVLITIVIGGFLYEIADGQDGSPYTQIGAVGGLTYIIAVAVLRWRS